MKLEPQDLRIGNYVYPDQVNHIYLDVREVRKSSVLLTEFMEVDINNLAPILLTQELLFRIGFYRSESYTAVYYSYGTQILVSFPKSDTDFFVTVDGKCYEHIHYLHQLQNLYYILMNKELRMNL